MQGPSASRVAHLAVVLCAMVLAASGDCPRRPNQEGWEHSSRRRQMMDSYSPDNVRCPEVNVALFPERIQLEKDGFRGTMEAVIKLNWVDRGLVVDSTDEAEIVRMNASEIWTPSLALSVVEHPSVVASSVAVQSVMADSRSGAVSAIVRTSLEGLCWPYSAFAWPRDRLECNFAIWPGASGPLNLTHHLTIAQMDTARRLIGIGNRTLERLSSWKLSRLDSKLMPPAVVVEVVLERLSAQLEAEVVHPVCLVASLLPASAALPPWSWGRPALLATVFLTHAVLLLTLPSLVVDMAVMPRNLLLYRDAELLVLAMVLQWLVSARLASRKRPLADWLRPAARALATLRTPLLLPVLPARPPQPPRRPVDEESVGMSEVLDRLTLLSAAAVYLAVVIVSLK